MPVLDPSWAPLIGAAGLVFVGLLSMLGVRASARSTVRAAEVANAAELIGEWRTLKTEIQHDADVREKRLTEELDAERKQREQFEERMTRKFNEVVLHFAVYVDWAKAGATPPPPHIPEWIYNLIADLRGHSKRQPSTPPE